MELLRYSVFNEVASKVGHGYCESACADPTTYEIYGVERTSVDVKISRSRFQGALLDLPGSDSTADEGEIPFTSCGPVNADGFQRIYAILVHEAGHAWGISDGRDDTEQPFKHPAIQDSVLTYNKRGLRQQLLPNAL